jgi:hypothetical protein
MRARPLLGSVTLLAALAACGGDRNDGAALDSGAAGAAQGAAGATMDTTSGAGLMNDSAAAAAAAGANVGTPSAASGPGGNNSATPATMADTGRGRASGDTGRTRP